LPEGWRGGGIDGDARRGFRRASVTSVIGAAGVLTRAEGACPAAGEHGGLRTVRLGGEARRSAARRVLAAAMAGAFAALQSTIPANAGKIPLA
jgi:hypothetical protein